MPQMLEPTADECKIKAGRKSADLISEVLPPPEVLTKLSLIDRQQRLQLLSQHPSLYGSNLAAAAATITQTAAEVLAVDRVTLWMYTADAQFQQIDSYRRDQDIHGAGAVIAVTDCTQYFEQLGDRSGLVIKNVAEAASCSDGLIGVLAQQNCVFHHPGALLEMPVRRHGKVVGALWCECVSARQWSALDRVFMLSIALHMTTAIEAQQQQALLTAVEIHERQLKRETIEREQAEQAWQESQRFINGIIDASTNILYVDSIADGRNVYINRWLTNVLGYEPEDVRKLGAHYLEQLVHWEEKAQMISERRKLATMSDGEVVENEYRFRHRQGHWRWLLCRETVFQRDDEGNPAQIFGTATDITKLKRAEANLHASNQELTRLAHMDGLTQVANRRSFDDCLAKVWKNIGQGHLSLSLILCDIDYFKSYNDTYGHQAGDECLKRVAKTIEQSAKRSNDLVARYGGEEFAVILPNTDQRGMTRVAQEIQRQVRQLAIPHSQSQVSNQITLSMGISSVNSTDEVHPEMLIAAADRALYQAKSEGRDRFCFTEIVPGQSQ